MKIALKTSVWIFFQLTCTAGFIECGSYRLSYGGYERDSDTISPTRTSKYVDGNLRSFSNNFKLEKNQKYDAGSLGDLPKKTTGNIDLLESIVEGDNVDTIGSGEQGSEQSGFTSEETYNTFIPNGGIVHQDSDTRRSSSGENSNEETSFQINIKADSAGGKEPIGMLKLEDAALSATRELDGILRKDSVNDHNFSGNIGSQITAEVIGKKEYDFEGDNLEIGYSKELGYDISTDDASANHQKEIKFTPVSTTYRNSYSPGLPGEHTTSQRRYIGKCTRTHFDNSQVNSDRNGYEFRSHGSIKEVSVNSGIGRDANHNVEGEYFYNDEIGQAGSTIPGYSTETDDNIKNTEYGGTITKASRKEATTTINSGIRQLGTTDRRLSKGFDESVTRSQEYPNGDHGEEDTSNNFDFNVDVNSSSENDEFIDQRPVLYRKEVAKVEHDSKGGIAFNADSSRNQEGHHDRISTSTGPAFTTDIDTGSESTELGLRRTDSTTFKKEIVTTETQGQDILTSSGPKAAGIISKESEEYISETPEYLESQDGRSVSQNFGRYGSPFRKPFEIINSMVGTTESEGINAGQTSYNTGISSNIDDNTDKSKSRGFEYQGSTKSRRELVVTSDLEHDIDKNSAENSYSRGRRPQSYLITAQTGQSIPKLSDEQDFTEFGKDFSVTKTEIGQSAGTAGEISTGVGAPHLLNDYAVPGRLVVHAYNPESSESAEFEDPGSSVLTKEVASTAETGHSLEFKIPAESDTQFIRSQERVLDDRIKQGLNIGLRRTIHDGQSHPIGMYYNTDNIRYRERSSNAVRKEVPTTSQFGWDTRTQGTTRPEGNHFIHEYAGQSTLIGRDIEAGAEETAVVDIKSEYFPIESLNGQSTLKAFRGDSSNAFRRDVTVTTSEPHGNRNTDGGFRTLNITNGFGYNDGEEDNRYSPLEKEIRVISGIGGDTNMKDRNAQDSDIGQDLRRNDPFSAISRSQLTQILDTQTGRGYNAGDITDNSESIELDSHRSSGLRKEVGNVRNIKTKENTAQDFPERSGDYQSYLIGNLGRRKESWELGDQGSTVFRKEGTVTTSDIGQRLRTNNGFSTGTQQLIAQTGQGLSTGHVYNSDDISESSKSIEFEEHDSSALRKEISVAPGIRPDMQTGRVFRGDSGTQLRDSHSYLVDDQRGRKISNGLGSQASTTFRKEVRITTSGNEQNVKTDGPIIAGSHPHIMESPVLYFSNKYPSRRSSAMYDYKSSIDDSRDDSVELEDQSSSSFRGEVEENHHGIRPEEATSKSSADQIRNFQNYFTNSHGGHNIPTIFPDQHFTEFRKDVKVTTSMGQSNGAFNTKTANYAGQGRNPVEIYSGGRSSTNLGFNTGIDNGAAVHANIQLTDSKFGQSTSGDAIRKKMATYISRSEDSNKEKQVGQALTKQFDYNTNIENEDRHFEYRDSSAERRHIQLSPEIQPGKRVKINQGFGSEFGYNFGSAEGPEPSEAYANPYYSRHHGSHYRPPQRLRSDQISDHNTSENQEVSGIRRDIEFLSEHQPITYTTVEFKNEPEFRGYNHDILPGRSPSRGHLIRSNDRREDNRFVDLLTNSRRPEKKEIPFDDYTRDIKQFSGSAPTIEPSHSFAGFGITSGSGLSETHFNRNPYKVKDQSYNEHVVHTSTNIDENGRNVYRKQIKVTSEIESEPQLERLGPGLDLRSGVDDRELEHELKFGTTAGRIERNLENERRIPKAE